MVNHGTFNLLLDRVVNNGLHFSTFKVLWRSAVIIWLCSQNSQAERIRYPVKPHYLSVMKRARGLDYICSVSTIPALGAEKHSFTFTFIIDASFPQKEDGLRILYFGASGETFYAFPRVSLGKRTTG